MSICIMIGMFLMVNLFLCSSLTWSGQEWVIKSGDNIGPGPNSWSSDNVFVDSSGNLHLKITYNRGKWECAQLYSVNTISYGTYQWWIDSSLDFDSHVVLQLSTFGDTNGQNEIDIQFSEWANPWGNPPTNARYAVWPSNKKYSRNPGSISWNIDLSGTFTTQRFRWNSQSVEFWAIGGHYNIDTTLNVYNNWKYTPSSSLLIPQQTSANMKLHMSLWLYKDDGRGPSDHQEVEVVIRGLQSDN